MFENVHAVLAWFYYCLISYFFYVRLTHGNKRLLTYLRANKLTRTVALNARLSLRVCSNTRSSVVAWCWVVAASNSTSSSFVTGHRATRPAWPEWPLTIRWPSHVTSRRNQMSPKTVLISCVISQPKVAETVQQHVSYEFTWIRRTCDYNI